MIFKYAFVVALGFILYKMVFPTKKIEQSQREQPKEDYTEYEEIED